MTCADFKVGETVGRADRDNQMPVGRITRLNMKSATIDVDNGQWRVSFSCYARSSTSDRARVFGVTVNGCRFPERYDLLTNDCAENPSRATAREGIGNQPGRIVSP